MIGEERRLCIKSIEIFWQGERRREAARLVGECINLQKLYIGVGCATTRHTKNPQDNLWLSRGVGQLKKIRALPSLDLRVREVNGWGAWVPWPVFELPIKGVQQRMFMVWPPKFDARHIREFEKGLKEEMGKAAIDSAEEEKNVVDNTVETIERTEFKMKEPKRNLRTRKADTRTPAANKTRTLPTRRPGKKRKVSRKMCSS
jgi:hypothetical protein